MALRKRSTRRSRTLKRRRKTRNRRKKTLRKRKRAKVARRKRKSQKIKRTRRKRRMRMRGGAQKTNVTFADIQLPPLGVGMISGNFHKNSFKTIATHPYWVNCTEYLAWIGQSYRTTEQKKVLKKIHDAMSKAVNGDDLSKYWVGFNYVNDILKLVLYETKEAAMTNSDTDELLEEFARVNSDLKKSRKISYSDKQKSSWERERYLEENRECKRGVRSNECPPYYPCLDNDKCFMTDSREGEFDFSVLPKKQHIPTKKKL